MVAAMKNALAKIRWQRPSITTKIFLAMLAVSLTISAFATYFLINETSCLMYAKLRESLITIARTAAVQVDGDKHRRLELSGNEQSSFYGKIKAQLAAVKRANPKIRFIYTMAKTDDPDLLKFVVDAETDPETVSHLGDFYNIEEFPAMKTAFREPTADEELTTDKWGTWLSGYAPIYDKKGRVVAILGVDMAADDVLQAIRQYHVSLVPFLALFILAPPIIGLLIARRIARSLTDMVDATERMMSGKYGQRVAVTTHDEIGDLANTLNRLAENVNNRVHTCEDESMVDSLTGLYNHRYFEERLGEEIERADLFGRSLALLVLDIDGFSEFNKAHGSEVGDSALKQIAALIKQSVRSTDVVTHFSGDKFTVLLPEASEEEACLVAHHVSAVIAAYEFAAQDNTSVSLTGSTGIARYPEHASTSEELIALAFLDLRKAKDSGCGQATTQKAG